MAERHHVIPAVIFTLEKDAKILLILRQNTGYADNLWSMPGGHVEPNEHALRTVVREAREELGIGVDEESIRLIGLHHIRRNDGHDGLNMYFRITSWQGEPQNTEPATCGGLEWFALDKLPANINPELLEVLAPVAPSGFLAGVAQSRVGSPSAA